MPITRNDGTTDSQPLSSHPQSIPPAVIEMLTAEVQRMIDESGSSDSFDAQSWLLNWLHLPVPALGWQCPADYLHTPAGIDLVSKLLASAQSGAYW